MTLSRFVVKMQIVHEYLPLTLVSPGKGLCLRLFCYNYNLGNIHSGEERVRAGFWASSKVFCLWWGSCYKFRIQQILTTVLWHSAYMWMLWQQEPWARQSGKKTPKINNLYCGEFTRLTWPEVSGQEGGRKNFTASNDCQKNALQYSIQEIREKTRRAFNLQTKNCWPQNSWLICLLLIIICSRC